MKYLLNLHKLYTHTNFFSLWSRLTESQFSARSNVYTGCVFLSWDFQISQEILIARKKNVHNKNFLFSREKSNSAKIYPTPYGGSFVISNRNLYFLLQIQILHWKTPEFQLKCLFQFEIEFLKKFHPTPLGCFAALLFLFENKIFLLQTPFSYNAYFLRYFNGLR